ncbi:MAG: hypothetical protein NVS1B7_8100 [Candidatus Saccharimonadales bacterium]
MNKKLVIAFMLAVLGTTLVLPRTLAVTSQSGSVGVQGTISAPPPTTGASISVPTNGQTFTNVPVTVGGLCPGSLLVKIFKNNVFSGSVQCKNGSYSLQSDLFSGQNEFIARVYDALDQAGPDSNKVLVTFNDVSAGTGPRISITSNFAKRGANPGETLSWPIILSGGIGPYALSADWGDGKTPDLMSAQFPGTVTIQHVYDKPGVYNIVVKGTDTGGGVSYIQLVGIANGALSQDAGLTSAKINGNGAPTTKTMILWQPAAVIIPFIISTFWLGKRYELKMIRRRIEQGDRPF